MEIVHFILNLGVALLMGVAIGMERQYRLHPAGLGTNALVCVGAAMFVSLSRLMGDHDSPTRIASYIVSGIGFLGGGVILREGLNVKGMNTAATLWCTAAIGTLSGAGSGGPNRSRPLPARPAGEGVRGLEWRPRRLSTPAGSPGR